ncbi:hypothetical protein FACS1894181_12140 [Bacteroidia bacterium]|nr:hypothetical protein FACS1894181_12140 [Bacteroidia bacterium]
MTQIILKNDIDRKKLETLLSILNSWDIEAEVKATTPKATPHKNIFADVQGIWKDYDMDAKKLRAQARERRTLIVH